MMKRDQNISESDELLMQRFARSGEQSDFITIYHRHYAPLCKYIAWMSGDLELSKDLAQSILIKVYERPELFDARRSFRVWLYSIANNRWKNEKRNAATHHKHLQGISQWPNSDEDRKPDPRRLANVKLAIQQLNEQQRKVFLLKYSNNLTIEEISQVCDCSQGTVKSRLFYALRRIREYLKISKVNEI